MNGRERIRLGNGMEFKIVHSKSKPNKNTKDEANKQKHSRITAVETNKALLPYCQTASCAFVFLCQPLAFRIFKTTLSGLKVINAFISGI